MSDRLVLRPGSGAAEAALFARRFGWVLVEDIARDERAGVDGLREWEAPDPLGSFFYCEDADFGLPYVAVSGTSRGAVDAVVTVARQELLPWTLPELTAAPTSPETMLLIGLAAPNEPNDEVFTRLDVGMRHDDERVRWAAVWATTYTGYDAFIPALSAIAENDPVDWVRGRAASVLGVFEDFRGEPPYTA